MNSTEKTHYEQILRAIGQGLEDVSIKDSFDLEVDGQNYVLRGSSTNLRSSKQLRDVFLNICKIFNTRTPRGRVSSSKVLCLTFSKDAVDKLERAGQASRSDGRSLPKPHSLPQLMRTVGWYLDKKQGRLLRLSKHGDTVSVLYLGLLGNERLESFTQLMLYDIWVRLYKKRKEPIALGAA